MMPKNFRISTSNTVPPFGRQRIVWSRKAGSRKMKVKRLLGFCFSQTCKKSKRNPS